MAGTSFIIAIDGPAASGKTTLARGLSQALGLALVETGRIYRGIGAILRRRRCDPADSASVLQELAGVTLVDIRAIPTRELDSEAVAQTASVAAAHTATREVVTQWTRELVASELAHHPGVVVEGRDIGTVVFPEASFKLFISASLPSRAARRSLAAGVSVGSPEYEVIVRELDQRDFRDRNRDVGSLRPAAGATIVDTTHLGVAETVALAISTISEAWKRR